MGARCSVQLDQGKWYHFPRLDMLAPDTGRPSGKYEKKAGCSLRWAHAPCLPVLRCGNSSIHKCEQTVPIANVDGGVKDLLKYHVLG
jgi:hypothetical protein